MCPRPVPGVLLLVGLWAFGASVRAVHAEAASTPSQDGIRVVFVPEYGVLGDERELEVRVELPPEATDLELFASEGEVGPLTPMAPGVFRAPYVPPRQRLPREVILTARARGPWGPLEGWSLLPLWGRGQAEVRTRPGAPVSLQVGERSFGPVQADAKGLARVPLTVPPGHREAFFGARRIDLGVPPWPCVHAVAERRQVRADQAETVDVRLFLSRLKGTPAPPGPFTFTPSRGGVSLPLELEPGVLLVRWTLPPGPTGEVSLQGGVGHDPRWSFEVRLEAVSGPAQRFELKVDREEVVASEAARIGVEVSAWDAAGNPRRSVVSLAPRLGGVTNFADVRAPSAGVRLEVWPVRAWPALGLMLDMGMLGFSRGGGTVVPGFSGRMLLFDTTVAVGLRTPREHGLQGWTAVGLSLARVHGRSEWAQGLSLAEGTWVPGAQALVGAGVALGPGQPFLEARVCWFDDPALHVLRGALGGVALHLGYRLELF
ncbi:hypothetical protein [Melittangium boletus]|uniref:Uncharacterized protein n=1 Tax=Melittangium boletus DSM 14713 TaxID=1294270 RepID=A0A250ILZ3_9BACT|nr:hypothetical protein [Melittangium boletus]ATB32774.1 hypothetical protein MEBOL_006263 [Melittangium boletus DSM 14713]